jgi:hypothetical protein
MSTEESPRKKQNTKFIPRLTIQETTPVLDTPIKRIMSVSIPPNVNINKRKLIDDIKNLRGEIVNSENVNSENIKNYIHEFTSCIITKVKILIYSHTIKLMHLSTGLIIINYLYN